MLCVWHAFIGSEMFTGVTNDKIANIDKNAMGLIGIMYIVFHLIYITHFVIRFKRYKKVGPESDIMGGILQQKNERINSLSVESPSNVSNNREIDDLKTLDLNDSRKQIFEATGLKSRLEMRRPQTIASLNC